MEEKIKRITKINNVLKIIVYINIIGSIIQLIIMNNKFEILPICWIVNIGLQIILIKNIKNIKEKEDIVTKRKILVISIIIFVVAFFIPIMYCFEDVGICAVIPQKIYYNTFFIEIHRGYEFINFDFLNSI